MCKRSTPCPTSRSSIEKEIAVRLLVHIRRYIAAFNRLVLRDYVVHSVSLQYHFQALVRYGT